MTKANVGSSLQVVTMRSLLLALGIASVSATQPDAIIATSSFHTVAKLPTVRSDMSLSVVGSKFVLVGGCVGTQVQYCPALTNATTVFDAEAFDFAAFTATDSQQQQQLLIDEATTSTVSELSAAPRARYRHASAVVTTAIGNDDASLLFLLGGRDLEDNLIHEVDVLDVESNSWWTLGNFVNATSDLAAFGYGSSVFVIGGYSSFYVASDVLYKLDTAQLQINNGVTLDNLPFEAMQPMPTARGDIGLALLGEVAVVIGGFNHENWCNPLATVEAYDAQSNTWATLPSMPTGRSDKGVTVKDGSIYVLGGESNIDCALLSGSSLPIDDVEVYTPNTANIMDGDGTWGIYGELLIDAFRFQAGSYGDELFLFGGQLLEELEDGSLQYPLTNNITAAYFVPFESPPGADACTAIVGDTNQDGEVSVLDIVATVNIIIQSSTTQPSICAMTAADIDSNGSVDVLDVVNMVNIITQG